MNLRAKSLGYELELQVSYESQFAAFDGIAGEQLRLT